MHRFAMSLVPWVTVAVLVGCSTITEELPTRPEAVVLGRGGSVPVVVVPVPIPTAPPPAPSGPNAPPAPPQPAPNPNSTPNPNPNPGPGIPPNIPPNNSPVRKVGAKVYFIEVNGELVPGSELATVAPFNSRIHLDCTPKDGSNAPTQAVGTPEWTYSPADLVNVAGRSSYNPVLTPRGRGSLSFYVVIDGVTSNTVNLRIE
jgi:hypothetical protein